MVLECPQCRNPLYIHGHAIQPGTTCPECHQTLQEAPRSTIDWTPDDGSIQDLTAEIEANKPWSFGNESISDSSRIDWKRDNVRDHAKMHFDWSFLKPRRTNSQVVDDLELNPHYQPIVQAIRARQASFEQNQQPYNDYN